MFRTLKHLRKIITVSTSIVRRQEFLSYSVMRKAGVEWCKMFYDDDDVLQTDFGHGDYFSSLKIVVADVLAYDYNSHSSLRKSANIAGM